MKIINKLNFKITMEEATTAGLKDGDELIWFDKKDIIWIAKHRPIERTKDNYTGPSAPWGIAIFECFLGIQTVGKMLGEVEHLGIRLRF